MGAEAIIVPIILDPKQGLAGLKAIGEEGKKVNQQFDGANGMGSKFSTTMKSIAGNALQLFGAMNLLQGVTKIVTESFINAISGSTKLASATKLLSDAQKSAVGSTRAEVVELQLLFNVAKDTSLTYLQRQAAIDKLNKSYPELHKNLNQENIGTVAVGKAIQGVIDNLVKKAQLQTIISQIAGMANAAAELREIADGLGRGVVKNTALRAAEAYENRIKSLTAAAVKLQGTSLTPAGLGSVGIKTAGADNVNTDVVKIKPNKIVIEKPKLIQLAPAALGDKIDLSYLFDFKKGGLGQYVIAEMEAAARNKKYDLSANAADKAGIGYTDQMEKANKLYLEMISNSERLTGQITGFLTPAFDSFIDAILTKQDALKAFFSAIGQSIKQLIKQLVQAAIQAAVLSLVTGGTLKGGLSFGKAFGKIFGFAEGGLVTSPVSALIGEGRTTNANNPEVVAPLDKLKKFFTNISGNNQGYAANNRMGMAGSFLKLPREVIVRQQGRDLVGVMTLENLSQGFSG